MWQKGGRMNKELLQSRGVTFRYRADTKISDSLSAKHCHSIYEIIFVVSGKGRYIVEGAEYELKGRTLALIPPLCYHCLELDPNTPYERYVIHFTPDSLSQDMAKRLSELASPEDGRVNFYSPDAISHTLISAFERYSVAASLSDEEREAYMRILLSEIVLLLSVSRGDKISADEGELGAKVIRYLNDNITANITLDKLAKRFFVSKYYLCRAFKKHNGISIHGYVNQKRVMYAKQLMEAGETASGAAYRVGFGDYSAFYRAYIKVIGSSPVAEQNRKERQ